MAPTWSHLDVRIGRPFVIVFKRASPRVHHAFAWVPLTHPSNASGAR